MIPRVLWGFLVVSLVGAAVGVAVAPDHMVAPGALIPAHAELATDCLACHAPLQGLPADRCITCHEVDEIGIRTTTGAPLEVDEPAFHAWLTEADCVACHSDHAGPRLTWRERKPFSHALLRASVREDCRRCHEAPTDDTHARVGTRCQGCHGTEAWTPATFRHDRLAADVREACDSCHAAPEDTLHASITGGCGTCHATSAWRPADFAHERFFVLDRDHDASCATCHTQGDFRTYTCYGCHEHTAANIAGEHREEGIRDFSDCVECHRSGEDNEHGRRGGGGEEEGEEDDD